MKVPDRVDVTEYERTCNTKYTTINQILCFQMVSILDTSNTPRGKYGI